MFQVRVPQVRVPQVRVLVVDDSVVVRKLVADALADEPTIEVVGVAANGRIALAKLELLAPDVVTLDIEMPLMDGLETLQRIRATHPDLPVIMFSTLTEQGASAALTALELGATDYVTKPAGVSGVEAAKRAIRDQLVPRISALFSARTGQVPATWPPAPTAEVQPARASERPDRVEVVLIGSSTGGPDALATVLGALPSSFPVPVVVVQHIPPVFSRQLASRLDTKVPLHVSEAADGDVLQPGRVLIAPGDHHLRLLGSPASAVVALDQGPQVNFVRPAVDVLFRSAVEVYGRNVLAVVLTGMGADGAAGAVEVRRAGGHVLVQDEQSSVVWGMPGAVVAAGVADQVLPLPQMAGALTAWCASRPASGYRQETRA